MRSGPGHSNGIESFWSRLKRRYLGIYHRFSTKRLYHYLNAHAERCNLRELDTIAQMSQLVMRA